MSDFGEAIGTAVEGGLFAKAVGGSAKSDTPLEKGHFAEGQCLNCGTELLGAHCHECGQKAHLHRTLGAFMHDLLHGALHFEGRTWRTLPKLFFKPGELTRRYIDGERARFVSPMALFLFSIFLMFAIFQFAGISTPTNLGNEQTDEVVAQAREQIGTMQNRRDELAASIESGTLSESEVASAERRLTELDEQIEAVAAAQQVPVLRDLIKEEEDSGEQVVGGLPVQTDEEGNTTIPLSVDGDTKMNVGTSGVEWIDAALQKWRTNPTLMLYKLQTNFYKFSWLLIPLSIPFVWLLFFWKRRFRAYDHAIFVTYSLSFMSLLILTITLMGLAGAHEAILFFSSVLIPPIHIYKHLRGAYGLSRFSAFWRLLILTVFILVVLTIFLQLLLLIGAL
ncbi:DUF3667 domain-containing protein [Qipengyuania sp. 1NDW9]|uniref:DUF3667 domain-containing protein n=1 Tax=Qipengyuania xiapuensis TaxID=2867236 RepID=UPI001C883973|nr:DUF3667 domain-containing protein [Qipengyuania xiapuensis]